MTTLEKIVAREEIAPPSAGRPRKGWTPRRVALVAVLLIVAQAVIRGIWVSQSWLLLDDFLFTSDIARGLDDSTWYLRIHQGHFMPLSFGLVKLAVALGSPFSWAIPATEIIVMQVVAAGTCWWMLRTLFGDRPGILWGLGFYLFSPLTMPSVMWWAVAINQLPNQIAFLGLLGSHVQYCRTRHRRWLILSSMFLTMGYLSYAKTGLMVVTIFAITLLWFSFGPPWSRFWTAVHRYRPAWIAYGAISMVWLYVYLERTPPVASVPPTGFLPLLQSVVWESLLPAITGGPWRWTLFGQGPISYVLPPQVGVLAAALVVGAVLAWSWGTRRRSLLILWPVAIYLAASVALVYTGRTVVVSLLGGSFVGQHLQYVSDLAPLLAFTLVALFLPVRGAFDPIEERPEPVFRFRTPRLVLAVGTLAFLAGSLWTSQLYAEAWRSYPDRDLTQRTIATIRADQPALADTGVPETILNPILGDKSLMKNYFAPLGNVLDVRTAGNDLNVFDPDGNLREVGLRNPESGSPEADQLETSPCLPVSSVGRWQTVTVPASYGLWLAVDYRATPMNTSRMDRTGPRNGASSQLTVNFGDTRTTVPILPGRHRALMTANDPDPTVRVQAEGPSKVCITSVRYGLVAPEAE